MVKLELPEKPKSLTPELQRELIQRYKEEKSSVWSRDFIKEAVLNISNGKCIYSECKLNIDSKYMEIDHFLPKSKFPYLVVGWGNLLPSCKKCNSTKSKLDPSTDPIINPLKDDPKNHLYIKNYRYYSKTQVGKRTINATALNDRKHFVVKRFKIGTKTLEILDAIWSFIKNNSESFLEDISVRSEHIQRLKNILNESTRENEYSATISTLILEDDCFKTIKSFLETNDFWDQELEDLYEEINFCSLVLS